VDGIISQCLADSSSDVVKLTLESFPGMQFLVFFLWVLWVFMGFPCDKNIRLSRNQTWPAGKSRINGGLYIAGKSTKKMADFPATFDDTPSGTTWDLNGVYPPVTHFDVAFTQHFQIILTGNQGFSTIQYEDNLKSQSQKSKGSKKVHEIGV